MNKNANGSARIRMFWDWLVRRHQSIFVFVCIFLLLFLGGYSFHFKYAVVFSFVDALYLMLFYDICTLIHRYLARHKRYRVYLTMFIVLVLAIFLLVKLEHLMLHWVQLPRRPEHAIYHYSRIAVLVLGTYIAWLLGNYSREQRKLEQLQMEKKEMEVRMLRSQLNPHFVFNTLNNIYSLVYTHDEKAPDSILQMADMCRYITDECQSDYVPIEKEINYIQNYIDLQRVRYGEKDITYRHLVDNSSLPIPPMLLQPLVENCFIHGDIAANANGYIRIEINVENGHLSFDAVNTKNTTPPAVPKQRDGIGISNVEQQLQHYYDNKYQLEIKDEGATYHVSLNINLLDK